MPLLKGDRFVADRWRRLGHGEPPPASVCAVIVPLARLTADAAEFEAWPGELGAQLEAGERVERLEPWLPRLSLVALSFPVFSDGRAFSAARMLRERYRFAGEVRAVGDVQVDRYQFMRQCGFDAFEVPPERAHGAWARAGIEMTLTYQPDYAEPRGAEAVWHARRVRQALAA